ncbi:MAG: glycosyltransferase [Gemmataceae bacterium]|nr:glycosyltransferase [Gemmataceae bacterium]MDW8266159.1 glycosyltransferase family 2 protein [Gemmataceae bacterium]
MADKTIAVVIPVYNREDCVADALKSACEQEPPPDEVLVLDDCSTDRTPDIVRQFALRYPFVRSVRYPEKSADWQLAMVEHVATSSVQYVVILSSDDLLLPGWCAAVRRAIADPAEPSIVFVNYRFTDEYRQPRGVCLSGVRCASFLPAEQVWDLFRQPRIFETGVGTLVARSLWVQIQKDAAALGPWSDSVGLSAAALRLGAYYCPEILAVFCHARKRIGYADRVCHDEQAAGESFWQVTQYLRRPELKLTPEQINTLEYKILTCIDNEVLRSAWVYYKIAHALDMLRAGRGDYAEQVLAYRQPRLRA